MREIKEKTWNDCVPFAQEDIALRIALALTRLDPKSLKALSSSNWKTQEAVIMTAATLISEELQEHFDMRPLDRGQSED